jgi:hypothetical protein
MTLSEEERSWMRDMAKSETDKVLALFRAYPRHKFPAHEVAKLTGIKEGHVKRSLTDLAQTDPKKENYMDQWGQPALIKLGKEHKVKRQVSPNRSVSVSCWIYNMNYKIKPARLNQDPPTEADGQSKLFNDPPPQRKNGAFPR